MVDKSTRYAKSSPWYCPLSRSKLFSKALSLKKYVRLVRNSCASTSAYKADDALPAYIRQNNISATRQRGLVLELAEKNNGEATSSEVMDLLDLKRIIGIAQATQQSTTALLTSQVYHATAIVQQAFPSCKAMQRKEPPGYSHHQWANRIESHSVNRIRKKETDSFRNHLF